MPNTPNLPAPKPEESTPILLGCLGSGWPLIAGVAMVAGFYATLILFLFGLAAIIIYSLLQLFRGG